MSAAARVRGVAGRVVDGTGVAHVRRLRLRLRALEEAVAENDAVEVLLARDVERLRRAVLAAAASQADESPT